MSKPHRSVSAFHLLRFLECHEALSTGQLFSTVALWELPLPGALAWQTWCEERL